MGTSKETVTYILDQLAPLPVRARAMFGEYALYCDEKVVGLICDDTLFIKPTEVAPALVTEPELSPPYPGAKDYYVISGDRIEDGEWLQALVRQSADARPAPGHSAESPVRRDKPLPQPRAPGLHVDPLVCHVLHQ